jgi:uncharacterized protein YceK
MKAALLLVVMLLAGCATCREHPTACEAAAAVFVAGAVIAIDQRPADPASPTLHIPTGPNCVANPASCR